MAEDEKKNWISCLGWGCLILFVLTVFGVGGCVFVVYRGGADARAVADDYLALVADGRYEEAYRQLGPRFTDERDLGELVAFEQAARHRLGPCGSTRSSGTSLNRESGRSVATLVYQLECDRGAGEIVFQLERVEGQWVIQGLTYRDSEAPAALSCADCGENLEPGGRFCPNCGAAVDIGGSTPDDRPEDPETTE